MVGNSRTDVFSMHRSVPWSWTPSTAGDDGTTRPTRAAHTDTQPGHAEDADVTTPVKGGLGVVPATGGTGERAPRPNLYIE